MGLKDAFNQNARQMTALEHAVRSGHHQIVDILLRERMQKNNASAEGASQHSLPQEPALEKKSFKVMKPLKLNRPDRRKG